MENKFMRFWSIIVIALSEPIIDIKREALSRIKLRSVNKEIRKIQKIDFQSHRKTNSDTHSYVSISDIKPLSNLYSSVKIYEQDYKGSQFQTKKQQIKHIVEESMQNVKLEDWMVARKAKMILVEEYPKSDFCRKSISNYSEQALNSIKGYKFEDFCASSLKKKKKLFYKQKNMMKYKKDSISDSLTHLPDTKIQQSLDMFDLILEAGAEKQSHMPTVWYVWKFISIVQQQQDDIRQQAYFQIIKQMSSNRKIYYQFLACMAATVQPSSRMYLPLLNYIYFHSMDPESEGFQQFHNFMFFSMIKNFSNPRKAPPSMYEVFCYMNLRKIPLLIKFPRQNIFFIEFYSTVEQILEELILLYGLNEKTSYLLNIEGILLQKGMILDGMDRARIRESQQQSLQRFMYFQGYRAFIVIKNMLQMDSCQQNFLIMYNYLVNQYRSGMFAITNKSSFQIGGLIIASEVEMEECYEFSLSKYLPRKKYQSGLLMSKIKQVQNMILLQYEKFKGTKNQARKKVIEKLSKSRAFLTHFFICNVCFDEQQFTEAWVGLKTESIIVVQPYTNRIIIHIEYQKIRKWGRSNTELCLKIQQIGALHIECLILDTLISIFTTYLSYLSEIIKKPKYVDTQIKMSEDQSRKMTEQVEID